MVTRNYTHFDRYLTELYDDIYEQPVDDGHTSMALGVINQWIPKLPACKSVIDMGCGQIAPQSTFEGYGISYTGVALGTDAKIAKEDGKNVINADMTFTGFDSESTDLIYARHSLEHTPFPLLTLMEWHRIARHWLMVILPSPDIHKWAGKNHYGVMNYEQARYFMERAGWVVIWDDLSEPSEVRLLCEKAVRK